MVKRDERAAAAPAAAPKKDPQAAAQRAAALDAVRNAREARRKAEEKADYDELHAVAAARNLAVTWDDIADALDMLQPNAVRKYAPLLVEHRTVTVRSEVERADTV
jgi:hypothetical protein